MASNQDVLRVAAAAASDEGVAFHDEDVEEAPTPCMAWWRGPIDVMRQLWLVVWKNLKVRMMRASKVLCVWRFGKWEWGMGGRGKRGVQMK